MKKLWSCILVGLIALVLGIKGTILTTQKIAEHNRPNIEIVVPPTRKAKITYQTKNVISSFENPQHKLCVVVIDHQKREVSLQELVDTNLEK
ncbi:hypothetical protein [Lapidilactobacillus wuchangensis]|uniref:hypothetical protein n=1 Tax=Lapidilactobacillus wuchangensis TaxID=2486001 RepID=UPI000F780DCC|nr:hypothetical protein [Lapidilactobacillus wuchangensis]